MHGAPKIYFIQINLKNNFRDQHGEHVRQEIADSGIKSVSSVKYYPVFRIEGDISPREIETIASRLLTDAITETYSILQPDTVQKNHKSGHEIEVWFKSGVTDAVASSVLKGMCDLGIDKNIIVKTGRKYVFEGAITKKTVEEIANRLLVNHMVQEFKLQ